MVAAAARRASDEGYVRLVSAQPSRSGADRVAWMLAADPPWPDLEREPSPAPGLRRYATDLLLPVGTDGTPATFHKAALIDLGVPEHTADGWCVEIGWRAATFAPLFPVFSGSLFIGDAELRIEGLYAPPGGAIGRIADRILLHVAANGTARWLLREIDRAAAEG
jgi:hypothetical protein